MDEEDDVGDGALAEVAGALVDPAPLGAGVLGADNVGVRALVMGDGVTV